MLNSPLFVQIFFGTLGTIGYFLISSAGVAGTLSISSCVGMYFLGMNALVWNDTALDGLTTQKVYHRLQKFSLVGSSLS